MAAQFSLASQDINNRGLHLLKDEAPKTLHASSFRKWPCLHTISSSQVVRVKKFSSTLLHSLKHNAGGAAACVTAGRLAAADPTLKILVRSDFSSFTRDQTQKFFVDTGSWSSHKGRSKTHSTCKILQKFAPKQ